MKTKSSKLNQLKSLGSIFGKITTAIVSGLPKEKFFIKRENKAILQNKKESFKPDSKKHYHRPMAKPAVEKQTLLKEKKKAKAVHK